MTSAAPTAVIAEAAIGRRYEAALDALRTSLPAFPANFLDGNGWARIFNGAEWFERDREHEEYFQYTTAVIELVAATAESMPDRRLGTQLAHAFLTGAQFRFTAHSDGDPRPLMRARARLFALVLSGFPLPRQHAFAPPASGSRPRLGIMFKHLAQDPETNSILPYFEEARAAGIDVTLFVASDRVDPQFHAHIAPRCSRVLRLPDDMSQAIQGIRNENIDILLFGNDITAKPSTFSFLSFFRLARIGACCISSLVTTASPSIDVYFGCQYYKERGFDAHFDERFISLPDPGFAFSYPIRPELTSSPINRSHMGLTPQDPWLISGASQLKLHKGLVRVWSEILRRAPDAKLLLYPFAPHFGGPRNNVIERIRLQFNEFGITQDRIHIANMIPGRDAVVSMLRLADVGLDSFPYPGVTTLVDAIEGGLPTVTLHGQSLRTSQGAGVMHSAGLDDLVVHSTNDYVEVALKLIMDPALRTAYRSRLADIMRAVPGFFRPKDFSLAAAEVYHLLHRELVAGTPIRPRASS